MPKVSNEVGQIAIGIAVALLSGCDRVPPCGDNHVAKTVVGLAEKMIENGFKPSEQEALSSIRTTTLSDTFDKGKDSQSGAKLCSAKVAFKFPESVTQVLAEMTENGEKVAATWESAEKVKLEDLRKQTLGIAPYSPLQVTPEIASRYADANMAYMETSGQLRRQIKSLREIWNGKERSIEVLANYKLAKDSGSDAFNVLLTGQDFARAKSVVPLVLKVQATLSPEKRPTVVGKSDRGEPGAQSGATDANEKQIALSYANGVAQAGNCNFEETSLKVASGTVTGVEGNAIVATYALQGCGGGNNWGSTLVVLSAQSGKVEMVADTTGPGFDEIKISNGQVLAKVTDYGPNDPRCCPSVSKPMIFSVRGNKLAP
jgi:hypothetical protein